MAFPSQLKLVETVDLPTLSTAYELTGADIMNVVQHCCLQALQRGNEMIHETDLIHVIKRELSKAGKVL